jgi:hypothetical protein
MAIEIAVRLLGAPAARDDGSGVISHQVNFIYQVDGAGPWSTVPNRSKEIYITTAQLKVINDKATGWQKNTAYVYLIRNCLDATYMPMPLRWSLDAMKSLVETNLAAAVEAARINTYITVALGLTYPTDFPLPEA